MHGSSTVVAAALPNEAGQSARRLACRGAGALLPPAAAPSSPPAPAADLGSPPLPSIAFGPAHAQSKGVGQGPACPADTATPPHATQPNPTHPTHHPTHRWRLGFGLATSSPAGGRSGAPATVSLKKSSSSSLSTCALLKGMQCIAAQCRPTSSACEAERDGRERISGGSALQAIGAPTLLGLPILLEAASEPSPNLLHPPGHERAAGSPPPQPPLPARPTTECSHVRGGEHAGAPALGDLGGPLHHALQENVQCLDCSNSSSRSSRQAGGPLRASDSRRAA